MSKLRSAVILSNAVFLLFICGCGEKQRLADCQLKNGELQNTITLKDKIITSKTGELKAHEEGLMNVLVKYADAYAVFENRINELETENKKLKETLSKTTD